MNILQGRFSYWKVTLFDVALYCSIVNSQMFLVFDGLHPLIRKGEKAFVLNSCVKAVFQCYWTDFCFKTIVK